MSGFSLINELSRALPVTESLMPVLFLGHGSPMNAITDNEFSRKWNEVGKNLPKPEAVLCISAHWETRGTYVTAMEQPRTIHDFYGFPDELFAVQYPAPGSRKVAVETKETVSLADVELDEEWGLDHGAWSVLIHLFPDAGIPVLQLSLDAGLSPQKHYELAEELSVLRRKRVLITGSGNMVHNLRMANFRLRSGYDWADEANALFKKKIADRDFRSLVNYNDLGTSVKMSVPTNEHYLPLLYALAQAESNENIEFFNDKTELGSVSMTSLIIGG